MSQAPSMPFFVDAYLADTGHLTTDEHGAYLLLLMAMWRRNGAVPDDDKDNARVTRMSLAKWRKVKPRLIAFLTIENGDITQKRLKKEWDYVAVKRAKNVENGMRGGRPTNRENNDIEKANGSVAETQTKANPLPYPLPYPKEVTSVEVAQALPPPITPPVVEAPPPKKLRKSVEAEIPDCLNRATRWDSGRAVPVEWIADAQSTRRNHGLHEINLDLEAAKFADHWASKPGKDGRKLDWRLTWLNWARGARGAPTAQRSATGQSYFQSGEIISLIPKGAA
jgi:uncharacterized protein YdaU (DUF1376 family)